jgi:acid phosphatase
MKKRIPFTAMLVAGACCSAGVAGAASKPPKKTAGIDSLETVVVIYAENRSFDHLYGFFPGANGLQHITSAMFTQVDRDGAVMKELPAIWGGLTAMGVTPPVTEAQTQHLANRPFAIDDPNGFNVSLDVTTQGPWNLFYQNQMQIDGGKNDKFVAYADKGSLDMGYYHANVDKLPLWKIAQRYTLADNFFMSAFGGSFLNHQWLICACTPKYPNADQSSAKNQIAVV